MAWEFSLLVVANVTAGSDELIEALRSRSEEGACRFTLVMPASGAEARTRLDEALERMREGGLENVEGRVGELTSVRGRHVVSKPPAAEAPTGPPPEPPQKMGVLAALGALVTRR